MQKFLFITVLGLLLVSSCQSGTSNSGRSSSADDGDSGKVNGKELYQQYCKNCHGADGTMQLNNAANLATSEISEKEMRHIIRNGKKMMMAYKNVLSEKEIDSVIKYAKSLRKDKK